MNVFKTKLIMLFIIFQLMNYACSPAPGSITKVDDNSYTFTVAADTATTGNTRGGGGRAYAGPTTITP